MGIKFKNLTKNKIMKIILNYIKNQIFICYDLQLSDLCNYSELETLPIFFLLLSIIILNFEDCDFDKDDAIIILVTIVLFILIKDRYREKVIKEYLEKEQEKKNSEKKPSNSQDKNSKNNNSKK